MFYTPYDDTLDATWTDFKDDQSGISKLQISLLSPADGSCIETSSDDMDKIVHPLEIASSDADYLFRSLLLWVSRLCRVSICGWPRRHRRQVPTIAGSVIQ